LPTEAEVPGDTAPVENRYAFSNADDAVEQFNSLVEEGRHSDAAQLLDAAMDVYPDDPRLPLAMGIGWMAARPEEAVAVIHRALDLGRDEPAIKIECAWVLYRLGDADGMRTAVKDIDPDAVAASDPVSTARFINLGGQIEWDNGDLERAELNFRRAYRIVPEAIGHGECLARVLAEQGKTAEALGVVRDALRYLPGDPALIRVLRELEQG
jgi:tetratricopeptide (TPR) repeat protein